MMSEHLPMVTQVYPTTMASFFLRCILLSSVNKDIKKSIRSASKLFTDKGIKSRIAKSG